MTSFLRTASLALLLVNVTAFSDPAVLLRAPVLPSTTLPALNRAITASPIAVARSATSQRNMRMVRYQGLAL